MKPIQSDLLPFNAECWLEYGRTQKHGCEVMLKFRDPLPDGHKPFWLPISLASGELAGWMRFDYITTARGAAIFAGGEWRPASAPAPQAEEQLLAGPQHAQAPARAAAAAQQSTLADWEDQLKAEHDIAFQRAALLELATRWGQRAAGKLRDAEAESDPMGKRLIEHGATCYFNCMQELQALIETWDVSPEIERQQPGHTRVFVLVEPLPDIREIGDGPFMMATQENPGLFNRLLRAKP